MPLFRANLGRSLGTAGLTAIGGYFLLDYLPTSAHASTFTQTSVAIISLTVLMVMIVSHHRRGGELMSQTQEEMILIGTFGLFWLAFLVAWRAFRTRNVTPTGTGLMPRGQASGSQVPLVDATRQAQAQGGWPCPHDALCSPKRRIETDVMKMLMSDYEVTLVNDSMQEFYVRFYGPVETPFAGGVWKIHVELPDQYPFKSPSIGFMNKIFHPNIDELSGSVCLDVINQTWSPMFDMINIFEVFLPQLLRYPNPNDPLNGEAAALLMRHPKDYELKVKDYVQRFATKEAADAATDGKDDNEDDEDDEMSDIGSFSDNDDPVGRMEL